MRYYLTDDQFDNLWRNVAKDYYDDPSIINDHSNRYKKIREDIWNKCLRNRFGLIYGEMIVNNKNSFCVIGTEDKLNWFLLHF